MIRIVFGNSATPAPRSGVMVLDFSRRTKSNAEGTGCCEPDWPSTNNDYPELRVRYYNFCYDIFKGEKTRFAYSCIKL